MNIIRSELEMRLKSVATIHSLPVSWEGVGFTKPPASAFLECSLGMDTTVNVTTDGSRTRQRGVFMVNVWWPMDNKGTRASDDIVSAIVSAYKVVPKIGSVSIEQTPNASKAIIDPSGWRITPITINYRYEGIVD